MRSQNYTCLTNQKRGLPEPRGHNPCRRPFPDSPASQSSSDQRKSPCNIYIYTVSSVSDWRHPYFAIYFYLFSLIENDSLEDHISSKVFRVAGLDTTEAIECVYILCCPGVRWGHCTAVSGHFLRSLISDLRLRARVIFCLGARYLTICHPGALLALSLFSEGQHLFTRGSNQG